MEKFGINYEIFYTSMNIYNSRQRFNVMAIFLIQKIRQNLRPPDEKLVTVAYTKVAVRE